MTPIDTFQYTKYMDEIKPDKVYTTKETREFLKISQSTIKRWLKKEIIRANKIGGRYRIMGSEILRIISPDLQKDARKFYRKLRDKTKQQIKNW